MANIGIVEGNDLMLYVNTAESTTTPVWSPTLHATSHTIDWGAETKVRKTKDTGKWAKKVVTGHSCTIKCDALCSYDAGIGYTELLKMMKLGEEVLLKFSQKSESTGNDYEEGLFVLTAVNQSTPAGEDATYSCTFENSGEILTKKKS